MGAWVRLGAVLACRGVEGVGAVREEAGKSSRRGPPRCRLHGGARARPPAPPPARAHPAAAPSRMLPRRRSCVTVKPRADIFRIHPPIFEHNVTAISVEEDLSDLEERVLPFLQDVPRAQVRRAPGLPGAAARRWRGRRRVALVCGGGEGAAAGVRCPPWKRAAAPPACSPAARACRRARCAPLPTPPRAPPPARRPAGDGHAGAGPVAQVCAGRGPGQGLGRPAGPGERPRLARAAGSEVPRPSRRACRAAAAMRAPPETPLPRPPPLPLPLSRLPQKLGEAVKAEAQLYYQGQRPAEAAVDGAGAAAEAEIPAAAQERMRVGQMGAAEAERQAEEAADAAGDAEAAQQERQERRGGDDEAGDGGGDGGDQPDGKADAAAEQRRS